ncbi:related to inner mitochondrial membrane peptidase 2 [Melanopsichium pennsylvanicum]|uniref:Mitochondrial inner membrane protease subunit 2 n=2 Tax=Melanopsichium pennsylvanicum TaxID=63383 RepID=A0AAJ5C3Z3_9BASI|nr:related to inner mitochondrial membrane peptidase 2 [Melanopsichium pennsylvanicum]
MTMPGKITCRYLSSSYPGSYSTSSNSTSTKTAATDSTSISDTTDSKQTTSSPSSNSTSKYPGFHADPNYRPRSRQGQRNKLGRTLFFLGWVPVAAFITSNCYSLGNVTGGSMSPTFNGPHHVASVANSPSDVVLLNRSVKYQHHRLKAGDVVTLTSPLDPRMLLIKRIIALPGDTVRVWVSGRGGGGGTQVGKPSVGNGHANGHFNGRWTRFKIPPGHVWIEGDAAVDIIPGSLERIANTPTTSWTPTSLRTKSRDSREFGPVPMGLITSRIDLILWPPARFGFPAARPLPSSQNNIPRVGSEAQQYPPSTVGGQDKSTQVNPSLARILDEMTQLAPKERIRAHPQDSLVSPYVDWGNSNAHDSEEDEESVAREVDGKDRLRKHAWNHLSRGGRLGDDAA